MQTTDDSITQVTVPKKITTTQSARRKLELSQVDPAEFQQELMGVDVGVKDMAVYLSSQIRFDIADRITDASISRSIDASTTLTVTINDYDRAVLNSGYLYNKLDVQVDGLWFRLTGVDKSGDELTLTFEDREIAILRTYNKWKIASRQNVTRAQFVLNMIREVREFNIPVVIPQLHTVQPLQAHDGDTKGVDAATYKRKGIPADYNKPAPEWYTQTPVGALATKLVGRDGIPINNEQIINSNKIISVGEQMGPQGVTRKLKVAAIMGALAESNLISDPLIGDGYFDVVLQQMNIVITQGNIDFLNAWAHREGIIQNIDSYNLLGTTLQVGDSFGTNDPGVQCYTDAASGIHAHASMLLQDNFVHLKGALASGDPESFKNDPLVQAEFLRWSGGGYNWPTTGEPTTPLVASGKNGKNPMPSSSQHMKQSKTTKGGIGLFHFKEGSTEDRLDAETSAHMFYNKALKWEVKNPHLSLNDLVQAVLNTDTPNAFGQYQDNADALVKAYGITGGMTEIAGATDNGQYQTLGAGGQFYFYRGTIENRLGQKIRKPQNSWDCIQKLADDVQWKAFFVSGTFYFMSEDDLIKQQPRFTMTEFTEGIINVDGNFYEHKQTATLTVTADIGRWIVPPGGVVVVQQMGPWDGRWLVTQFDRSLFNTQGTITLSRESPALPEPNPKNGNKGDLNPTWYPKTDTTKVGGSKTNIVSPPQYEVGTPEKSATLAKELLKLHNKGWTDYNTGYQQMLDTAAGKPLYFPGVGKVTLDARIIAVIIWLISDQGYDIGTYAWCTDHTTWDGPTGHNGGHAVDIEYINGYHIREDANQCYLNVIAVDKLLNALTGYLAPRQIISGGYGDHRNAACTSYTRPVGWADQTGGGGFSAKVMGEHCNHIHVGY